MSANVEVYLARHGQAGGLRYNELTALGREQAQALGRWLKERRIAFDVAVSGSLERQQETLDLVLEKLGQNPARSVLPALDEISPRVWFAAGEVLRRRDPEFREQFEAWLDGLRKEGRGAQRGYLVVLEKALRAWIGGELAETGIEGFAEFQERVLSAPAALAALGGKRILAISSGTPIALLIGRAQQLGLEDSLDLMRRLHNTALSIFDCGPERWLALETNQSLHLENDSLRSVL